MNFQIKINDKIQNNIDEEDDETISQLSSEEAPCEFFVTAQEAGLRLDNILKGRLDFSRSQLTRQIKAGLVQLDDRPAKASALVNEGQHIRLTLPEIQSLGLKADPELKLKIIYEDEDILLLNKDWGLAVHPAPGYHGPTVAAGLLAYNDCFAQLGEEYRAGLAHRLDKDTSGVLICAKNEKSLLNLTASFKERSPLKRYLAFVRGCPKEKKGLIDSPIGRHPNLRHKMAAGVVGGRPALSLWRLLKHFPEYNISLILLTIVSGRTHQARVHLQSLGLAVLADPLYSRGTGALIKLFPNLAPHLKRQMLHARRLSLAHPTSGKTMNFYAPWPDDFIALFSTLNAS